MKMPKEILLYICDYDNGKPIFAVAANIEDVPSECDGDKIGVYTLSKEYTFKVKRQLF